MFVLIKNQHELYQIYNTIPNSDHNKGDCETIFLSKYDGKVYVDMDSGEWKFLFKTTNSLDEYLTFDEWKLYKALNE